MFRNILGRALVTGLASSSLGQTTSSVATPTPYMWAPYMSTPAMSPTSWSDPSSSIRNLVPMIHVDAGGQLQLIADPTPPTFDADTHPYDAGRFAAQQAMKIRDTAINGAYPAPQPFKVCLMLKNIGRTDSNAFATSYFRVADAVPEPQPNGFQWPDVDDAVTKHAYLHPFLTNAGSSSPIKAWVASFVAGYKAEAAAIGAPSPDAVYLDCEADIVRGTGRNPVYFLEELARRPAYWNAHIPGQDQSKTMADLYQEQAMARQWVQNNVDHPIGILTQLVHGGNCIDIEKNREVMQWWISVVQGARDAVLANAVYTVVKAVDSAHPQWQNIKCGNYDDVRTDGVNETTSWFLDRSNLVSGSPELYPFAITNQNPYQRPTPILSQTLPRCDDDRSTGGVLYRLDNGRRWLGVNKKASGQIDAPILYELLPLALNGYQYTNPELPESFWYTVPGFRQKYAYAQPFGRLETEWETVLRMSRHKVESIINSFPATGTTGQHSDRLSPWVQMPWTNFANVDQQAPGDFRSMADILAMTAMLRAKNVPEIQYFTTFEPTNGDYTDLDTAWQQTSEVIRQVYATRVKTYTLTPSVLQTQTPDKLEYTLRDSGGALSTVDVSGSIGSFNTTEALPSARYQELLVDFKWVPGPGDGLLGRPGALLDSRVNSLRINIEYETNQADTYGEVYVLRRNNPPTQPSVWVRAYTIESTPSPRFACNPATNFGGKYTNRVTVAVKTNDTGTVPDTVIWNDLDGIWKTRVKIRQSNAVISALVTKYDLVQLYPDYIPPVLQQEVFAVADLNMDGVVDANDLVQFIEAYIEEAPSADLNMNNSVDLDDLDTFLNAM